MPTANLESGLKPSYHEHGDVDGLPVVLLPGPTDAWRSYQPVLDRLPREIRAIAVSQRLWGNTDVLVTRGMQDQPASTIPNAEVAVYDGIGHTPRWERPERFAEDVTRFVREVFGRS